MKNRLLSPFKGKILPLLSLLVYLFLYIPIIVLVIFSVNDSRYAVSWQGFTLKWYQQLFNDPKTIHAFYISIWIALLDVGISTILGTITAIILYRFEFWAKNLYEQMILIPLFVPAIVHGISHMLFFNFIHWRLGFSTILVTHVGFSIPLVALVVLARMERIDWTLEEAAMDLGADEITTYRKVIFPLLTPGMLAAALLCFPWSFNDFVITYFVAGPGSTTLPIRIYSMIRIGVSPVINALSSLIIFGSLLLIISGTILETRKQRRTS